MYIRNSKPAMASPKRDRLVTFNDLINDLFSDAVAPLATRVDAPKVNLYNETDRFRIEMVVPGFEKEQFKITVHEERLEIAGTYDQGSEPSESCCTRKEHVFKSFSRSFNLPETANPDLITASYNHGVLQVFIPKREEAKPSQPKQVTVS